MTIKENVIKLKKDVFVLAVTKKRTANEINEAISSGVDAIGESQLKEFLDKKDDILPCKKHFVGHIQSNKAKKIVEEFDVIEGIDSFKIAKEIDNSARNLGKLQEVFFQVNIGREDSKYGMLLEEAKEFYGKLLKFTNIKVTGIMCIPPFDEDPRPYFRKMKELFDELPVKKLSMGMSDDFEIAIEEGATEIRIGRAIFGERI